MNLPEIERLHVSPESADDEGTGERQFRLGAANREDLDLAVNNHFRRHSVPRHADQVGLPVADLPMG